MAPQAVVIATAHPVVAERVHQLQAVTQAATVAQVARDKNGMRRMAREPAAGAVVAISSLLPQTAEPEAPVAFTGVAEQAEAATAEAVR